MKQVVFMRELADDFYRDARPLIERHNAAIEGDDEKPLEIAEAFYRQAEADGKLRIYTLREMGTGKLGGYAVFYLTMHQHRARFIATADAFFVDPEFKGLGLALLRFTEKELEREGVERIYQESRPSNERFGRLLEHLGYLPVCRVFGKDVN